MVVKFTLNDIADVAKQLISLAGSARVIAFHGEMGAGKTTLIDAICHVMEVTDTPGSPTFSIINEYKTAAGQTIYHMDLYRLSGEQEAASAGVEDCLYSGNLCFVEWPEKIQGLLPDDTLHCYIRSTGNNERKLEINL